MHRPCPSPGLLHVLVQGDMAGDVVASVPKESQPPFGCSTKAWNRFKGRSGGLSSLAIPMAIGLLVLLFFMLRAEVTTSFRSSAVTLTPQGLVFSPLFVGPQNPANASVEAIEYLVSRIMICTEISLSGTAFQQTGRCVDLYTHDIGPSDTRYETLAELLPLTSSFTNFMNPAHLAALKTTTSIDLSKIGSYNWGLMNWHSFMRLKATVTTNSGAGTQRLSSNSCLSVIVCDCV